MTRSRKIVVGIVLVILLCGAFMAGGFIGFNNGYAFRVFQASVAESYFTMRTLELLNAGDLAEAKKYLESELDSHIIEHWSGLINKPLNFTMLSQNDEAINRLMSKVVAYRTINPRKIDDAKVKETIETVVNRYKK
ncbi:MAG: hypothetical protein Q8P28_07385 [Deltaproteobacteria bacterium]|nr:hypothetical protein [Deltaproteobacteria bacterium]